MSCNLLENKASASASTGRREKFIQSQLTSSLDLDWLSLKGFKEPEQSTAELKRESVDQVQFKGHPSTISSGDLVPGSTVEEESLEKKEGCQFGKFAKEERTWDNKEEGQSVVYSLIKLYL